MYQVIRDFPRPESNIVESLSMFSTPLLSDAMGRYNCMDSGIKPACPGMKLCGPALTVNTYMADNLLIHLAIKLARPGDILVVSTGGCEAGYWGELMALSAKVHGIGGLVIDGGVRDSEQLCEMGFPVFSRWITPRGTFKLDPGSVNVDISCGGVAVSPGDIIIGDADGVVVVPAVKAAEVLERAGQAETKEAEIRKRILDREYIFDILNLDKYVKV